MKHLQLRLVLDNQIESAQVTERSELPSSNRVDGQVAEDCTVERQSVGCVSDEG